MKKYILKLMELADEKINEAKEKLYKRPFIERWQEIESMNSIYRYAALNYFNEIEAKIYFYEGFKEAMIRCFKELEERENQELEKMYEEQKNNI